LLTSDDWLEQLSNLLHRSADQRVRRGASGRRPLDAWPQNIGQADD